jgi:hypothetical protein
MNRWFALLCILFTAVSAHATAGARLPMRYEGGTLPLGQGKTHASISEDRLVFTQGHRKLAIPLRNITAIACNTDVRRRFGAPVLGAVPIFHLDTAETYYVGLTWTSSAREGQPAITWQGIFKLSSSEYSKFLTTLEHLTGKKAVDTRRVPAVVRYGI